MSFKKSTIMIYNTLFWLNCNSPRPAPSHLGTDGVQPNKVAEPVNPKGEKERQHLLFNQRGKDPPVGRETSAKPWSILAPGGEWKMRVDLDQQLQFSHEIIVTAL